MREEFDMVIQGQMDCKIYPSCFSGEVIFQVAVAVKQEGKIIGKIIWVSYEGIAPKHYVVEPSIQPTKDGVDGQVKVHILSNDGKEARVRVPDGQVLPVSSDKVKIPLECVKELQLMKKQCLAVVRWSGYSIECFLNKGMDGARAIHGVRDITIVDVEYDKASNVVVFLVYSKDVPLYVAFNKINKTLYTIVFRGESYPELSIVFEQKILKVEDR